MNRNTILILLIVLIGAASCAKSKAITTSQNLQRQWMIKTLPGISNSDLIAAKAEINLSDMARTGAYGGCNRIFFTTKTSGTSSISFENIGATKMYCEKTMPVEDALITALNQIKKYKIKGHHISFINASGEVAATAVAADWD